MPSHTVTIEIPELRWSPRDGGGYVFSAGDAERGFEATMLADTGLLTADYHCDGDGGRGDYWIESGNQLRGTLAELLLYSAGLRVKGVLAELAEASVRDGQSPLPEIGAGITGRDLP